MATAMHSTEAPPCSGGSCDCGDQGLTGCGSLCAAAAALPAPAPVAFVGGAGTDPHIFALGGESLTGPPDPFPPRSPSV